MKTTIVQMLRFGRSYRVRLGCGCKFEATLEDAKRGQLFIGKPVTCAECGEGRG